MQILVCFLLLLEEPWYTERYANVRQISLIGSSYQLGR